MSNQNRQPAGVPIGGQFAAKTQRPAMVSLVEAAGPTTARAAGPAAAKSRRDEVEALTEQSSALTRRINALSAGHVADLIHARYPEAQRLQLIEADADEGHFWHGAAILGEGGTELARWDDLDGDDGYEQSLEDEDDGYLLANLDSRADHDFVHWDEDRASYMLDLDRAQQAAIGAG